MSLQVWLPLTGDLHNQGLSDVTITNSDVTVNNNGKIGKCIKTGNSAIDLRYDGAAINTESMSIGGWFKFNQSEIATRLQSATINETRHSPIGNIIGNNSYGGIGLIWEANNMYQDGTLNELHVFGNMRSSTLGYRSTGTYTISFDQWTHIFLIFDKSSNTESLYVNGVRVSQITSLASFSDASTRNMQINAALVCGGNGPGVNIPFYCNDVRIYNHALTESEVKEISRGLVLHYPLNDRYAESTVNMITSLRAGGRTVVVDNNKIQNTGENADTYFYLMNPGLVAGETYTVSYYCQGLTSSNADWKFGVGAQSASHANHCGYIAIKNGWNELTFVCPEGLNGNTQLILDDYTATWRTSVITFSDFQLEHNDHKTGTQPINTWYGAVLTANTMIGSNGNISNTSNWYTTDYIPLTPSKSYTLTGLSKGGSNTYVALYNQDKIFTRSLLITANQDVSFTTTSSECYFRTSIRNIAYELSTTAKLLYKSTLAHDISGFDNNGTITGALSTPTDTPRYKTATYFDGSTSYIQLSDSLDYVYNNVFTISMWINPTIDKRGILLGSYTASGLYTANFELYTGHKLRVHWHNGDVDFNTAAIPLNVWTHIAFVKRNSSSMYVYKNGELFYTASTTFADIAGDIIPRIGKDYRTSGTDVNYKGGISDLRIYTTALSADDIKELYEMGVSG